MDANILEDHVASIFRFEGYGEWKVDIDTGKKRHLTGLTVRKLHNFLNHLNSILTNSQCTMEMKSDNQLPFLDIDIYRRPDGIPCKFGKVYVRQTRHSIETSIEEHHHRIQFYHMDKLAMKETAVTWVTASTLMTPVS
jgi:hypothetical protein